MDGDSLSMFGDMLAGPRTKQRLNLVAAERVIGLGLAPLGRTGLDADHFPMTPQMLLSEDERTAFSVSDGIPVLLWPEAFAGRDESVDLKDAVYFEAYSEMAFYNARAGAAVDEAARSADENTPSHNAPAWLSDESFREAWVDLIHDSKALEDSLDYLTPIRGSDFVQLGGDGRYAVRALQGGANRAVLITPMLSEARQAREGARAAGVGDRLLCVLGIGEELPLASSVVDKIFSPACMHHMQLDLALPEMKRALRKGGRFAAYDPWRAPLYGAGSAVFGKRNAGMFKRSKNIMCNPLTETTIKPLEEVFPSSVRRHHGPLLRYPLCACEKLGIRLNLPTMAKIADIDDRLGELLHLGQNWGSSMMFGGEA